MVRAVKGEPGVSNSKATQRNAVENNGDDGAGAGTGLERRVLRSRYLAVKNLISDNKDDISKVDSDNFKSIIDEVESLHQLVHKPREQVADAEALLDITNTIMSSVKAQSNDGITAADYVSSLLKNFGQHGGGSTSADEPSNSVNWKDIGVAVSHVLRKGPGCCTMLGPMNVELKQRKVAVHRTRARPGERARPEELDGTLTEERKDTDENMATMFEILRKNRKVQLEKLVLNRTSFAQTVENVFALSFLVNAGRAEIKVDEKGCHLVSPRNAPAANAVASQEVAYSHFIFRFDFRDWKLMLETVGIGDELMPHRNQEMTSTNSQPDPAPFENTVLPTTPIRKLSRNRGLVLQEQTVVQDSPESGDSGSRAAAIRKGKRKLR